MILVSTPISNFIPSSLSRHKAWAEASITAYSQPSSTISLKSLWSIYGSGVVKPVSIIWSPIFAPSVPITPTLAPANRRTSVVVFAIVVLPFVPVIAIILSLSQALPKKLRLAIA